MLINQTLDKLEVLGLVGMVLGVREQLESSQYLSLSFRRAPRPAGRPRSRGA
jgi:hypothetical protein